MFKRYGLDHYSIHLKQLLLLRQCRKSNLFIYHVHEKEEVIYFDVRVKDRNRVQSILPTAKYLYTSGIVGMLLRNFTNKTRLISYASCILIWCILSSTIFHVEVYGTKDQLDQRIVKTMDSFLYQSKNVDKIKKTLLDTYQKDVSWLEVYDKGSIIKIRYAAKEKVEKSQKGSVPLVAKKDGMIAYFKSDAGYKVKKAKDIVKKGDILVDNHMPDSFNRDVSLEVSGKVYAYTWQRVVVEMNANRLPEAINYFSLLLEARNQIDIDLKNEEKIVKENILQFSKNQGKIKLEILYTLLEDITS